VPIRTVLFTALSKFDGEKVRLLSARDFQQIAGRAGRRGFDTAGSVVCQAPDHVIENLRQAAKSSGGKRGSKKKEKKKPPPRGFVGWTRDHFEQLAQRPPEPLQSQLRVSHGMVVALLQRGQEESLPGSGYRELIALIDSSFESAARKRRLRRDAALLFRSLRRAEVVRLEPGPGGARARVDADLQRDFDLHHTLSLYLVDAVAALDPSDEDYALDVLSCIEAILENPRVVLQAQVRQRKSELIAELKADRVPYEERMEKLEGITWDKPNADFLYATFDLFRTHHPWVGDEAIAPKSIAREIWEGFVPFDDYVKRYGLARAEGVLLRYLNQVHTTLARNLPESARNDEILEVIGFLRAMLARVDSSLVEEWETLVRPDQGDRDEDPRPESHRAPRRLDRRSFEARARAELHQLLLCLSRGDYEGAAACLSDDTREVWDAARIETEIQPVLEVLGAIRADPEARRGHWTRIEAEGELRFQLIQTLIDETGEGAATIEVGVELEETRLPAGPMLRLRAIGV
jgi:hypothetical protein